MDSVTITINGNVVHHDAQREGGVHFAPDASHTDYHILQSFSPLDNSQREGLSALEVGIQQVISGNTYFCKYNPHKLQELQPLPFLNFVNSYHPDYVVKDALKAGGCRPPDKDRHKGWLKPEDLVIVTKFNQVRFINEVQEDVTFNWIARGDINIADPSVAPVIFQSKAQYKCEGFDDHHPAFTSVGSTDTTNRLTARSYRNKVHGGVTDVNAHGTHVAGSVAGNWDSPGVQAPVMGTAPKAKLFCQVLFEQDGSKVDYPKNVTLQTIIKEAKDQVASNDYTLESVDIDKSAWDNRDLTILFAVGNSGRYATTGGQIGARADSKNCITVGACEPSHPLDYNASRTPVSRFSLGQPIGSTNRIGFFSSVGLTKTTLITGSNSRIKPDVVAPGAFIYSAKSSQATKIGDGVGQQFDYLGTPLDNTPPNDLFVFQQGTSMATPIVAGCCAVIVKALRIANITISSALVKAILINGTTDITTTRVTQRMIGKRPIIVPPADPSIFLPETEIVLSATPSPQQDFGRINQAKTLLCIPAYGGSYGGVYLLSGQPALALQKRQMKEVLSITIPTTPSKLTVTMCYTDAPSVPNCGGLVNVVAMNVKAGDQVRYGNKSDTDTQPDRVNNVQKVVWTGIPVGDAKVCIKCFALNWGPRGSALNDRTGGQDFDIAWYLEWVDTSGNAEYRTLNNSMTLVAAIELVKDIEMEIPLFDTE